MSWLDYGYLALVLIACAGVLALLGRRLPLLATPQEGRRRPRAELGFLGLILLLGLVAIYGNYYVGRSCFAYADVGSDTLEQYVPYYLNLLDSVRNGNLGAWNFDFGLGVSFTSYLSWTLDPFNLALIPMGLLLGSARLSLALVLVQSLKVVLAGFIFDHLLTFYCQTPLGRMLGAVLFAFGGYLMLWGQHYWLGSAYVMCATVLLMLELHLERRCAPTFAGLVLAVALSVMMSAYSGLMIMLMATLHALLRVGHMPTVRSARGYALAFASLAAPVACGILMSCLTLVPYALAMSADSTRIVAAGDATRLGSALAYLGDFVPLRWLLPILSRVLADGLISSGEPIPPSVIPPTESFRFVNVYEFIAVGSSGAAFVLLSQFFHWVWHDATRRDKVLVGVATALVVAYCTNGFLPALTNVFAALRYRSSLMVVIPICLAMAVGFERRLVLGSVVLRPFFASAALTALVIVWSLLHTVNGRLLCLLYLVALVALSVLVVLKRRGVAKGLTLAMACACIVTTSVADGFFVTNNRVFCTQDNFPAANAAIGADTVHALNYLRSHDDSFYRVEKLYTDWTDYNDGLVQGYSSATSYNSTLDNDVCDFYETVWPQTLDGDIAYQRYPNAPDSLPVLNLLSVKYILARDELSYPWVDQIAQFGDVRVYENARASSLASVRESYVSESEIEELSSKVEFLSANAILPDEVASNLRLDTSVGADVTYEFHAPQFRREGTSTLVGTVSNITDGVVVLSVPNALGWQVSIDGKRVDTFRADYGFVGLVVPAGTHEIKATFVPAGVGTGGCLCTVGLGLACFGCVALHHKNRRRGRASAPGAPGVELS